MLMDEPMKGVKKEPMVAMRRVDFLSSIVILKREGGMVFKLLAKVEVGCEEMINGGYGQGSYIGNEWHLWVGVSIALKVNYSSFRRNKSIYIDI